ncbi:MAG: M48 family metallopeptidase [Myxococcales bacterium]|nr:M48 family metallopeptidase [Myxococcales bacterium]
MSPQERLEEAQVLARLRRDAEVLAARFRLRLRDLSAERPAVRRRYGICYEDGSIRIRLRHAKTGAPLKYSGLIDTLCHELAHLRHFNHGRKFEVLYRQILSHARWAGIYRPALRTRRTRNSGPPLHVPAVRPAQAESAQGVGVQLDLFR